MTVITPGYGHNPHHLGGIFDPITLRRASSAPSSLPGRPLTRCLLRPGYTALTRHPHGFKPRRPSRFLLDLTIKPETPLRNSEAINYASKEDPSVIAVHAGYLERKKRFTRTYRKSYLVLMPVRLPTRVQLV